MTRDTPVERITGVLTDVGYRLLSLPLVIAAVKFDVPAALIGTGLSSDLIVVLDTVQDNEARIQQKLEGVAKALDVIRSRRPLTAILVGPRPSISSLDSLARVCRTLPIGSVLKDEAAFSLQNWLAALMPLKLPNQTSSSSPSEELVDALANDSSDPDLSSFILAAQRGSSAVEEEFRRKIVEVLGRTHLDVQT